jgi:hypothetical protein
MSDYEDRIRAALHAQADRVDAAPEPEVLADRIVRSARRRNRGLAVALVLALFAGPTLGFVVGRGGNGDASDEVAAGADDAVVASDGPLPTIPAPDASGQGSGSVSGGGWSAYTTRTLIARTGQFPLGHAFDRDVNGTKIRVYRAAVELPTVDGPSWWKPPAWCFPNGTVQADVSTDTIVGVAGGSLFPELRDAKVGGALTLIGVAEQHPMWVAVVQAPKDAARVRASFAGGATDEMAPVDGLAVLVGAATADSIRTTAQAQSAALEAFDANGASLGRGTATLYGLSLAYGDATSVAVPDASTASGTDQCAAPHTLPPPGAEQPADPAAARAAIEQLFGHRYDEISMDERVARIDDPTGMREVFEKLEAGPYGSVVKGSTNTLKDLVFLSATRAATLTDTNVPGYPPGAFANMVGEVVLVDGTWKTTRATVCTALENGGSGVTCPPSGATPPK